MAGDIRETGSGRRVGPTFTFIIVVLSFVLISRAANHTQRLLDLISQFPKTNPSETDDTDFPKLFRQIRSRYKALCSTLGVRPSLRYSDRSQERDGTADVTVSEPMDNRLEKATVWKVDKGPPRGHAFDF